MSDSKHALPVTGSKLRFFFVGLASLIRCCFKKDCALLTVAVAPAVYEDLERFSYDTGFTIEDTICFLLFSSIAEKEASSDE